MDIVKCRRCGQQVDKRVDDYVKLSNGYAHKQCEDNFQIKKNTVICQVCRKGINKLTDEYIKKSNGYIHKSCVSSEDLDKKELNDYICEIFHLKAPGPTNSAMIKRFHEKNGYSYKSMYYALKYYFEVKKGSVEKSQNRIGILPYIYDDAKNYYSNLTNVQNKVLVNIEKQLSQEEKVVVIKKAPSRRKKDINLEDLV